MKRQKIIAVICLLILIVGCFSGCKSSESKTSAGAISENAGQKEYDPDDISGLKKGVILGNFAYHGNSLEEMEAMSEYVVVATCEDGFLEANQVWNNMYGKGEIDIKDASIGLSHTERKFKVNKVYKGENKELKEFILREHLISDGKSLIYFDGEFPVRKGETYLIFMYRARGYEDEFYAYICDGKCNLNGTQSETIDPEIYKQIKEKYKEEFE